MEQEGFRTMRTGSDRLGQEPDTPALDALLQPEWGQQVEAWRVLLGRCALKASRKRVRSLRIATLRLQAALEQGPALEGVRAVKRWKTQGKKLRRSLQPVRAADVYLQKLASLRTPAAGPRTLPCSRACLREIGTLENRIRQQRESAAEKLRSEIEERRERLERRSRELEKALESATDRAEGAAAWQLFVRLNEEFKELNGANLHEYRKGLKKVRYLAEADPQAGRLALPCKKMLDAAGDWHDWQELAREAGRGVAGKEGGLAAVLGSRTEEALRRALVLCRRSRARLLKSQTG
jgi:CHAD domain-containing protein